MRENWTSSMHTVKKVERGQRWYKFLHDSNLLFLVIIIPAKQVNSYYLYRHINLSCQCLVFTVHMNSYGSLKKFKLQCWILQSSCVQVTWIQACTGSIISKNLKYLSWVEKLKGSNTCSKCFKPQIIFLFWLFSWSTIKR